MTSEGELAIPQYSPEPSTPRRLSIRSLPPKKTSIVKAMRARIKNGRSSQNDPTRSTTVVWDVAEYTMVPGKIAAATFTSFDTEP